MRPHPAHCLVLALSTALSCETPAEDDRPAAQPPEPPPAAQVEPVTPSYAIHEWGLVDYVLADATAEIAAGPGRPEPRPTAGAATPTPPPELPPSSLGTVGAGTVGAGTVGAGAGQSGPTVGRRKPVLYVHLLAGQQVTFSARVSTPPGRVVEHWPPAEAQGDGVAWREVTARAGNCGGSAYPSPTDPTCTAVPDGHCEAAELRAYETTDGACLSVGGSDFDHLFYRGAGPGPTMPLALERDGSSLHATWVPETAAVGPIVRVSRAGGAVRVARAEHGACGERRAIGAATSSDGLADVQAEVGRTLRALGLSDPEARAFEQAWMDELFGPGGSMRDALVYFLPRELADSMATLSFEPPPAQLSRVLMVRVDLGG